MKGITDDQLVADRGVLGDAILDAYKAVNPGGDTWRTVDVVEKLVENIDPADYVKFLRVALFDSVEAYFEPALNPLAGMLAGLLGDES